MGKDLEIILYEGPVEETGEGKHELSILCSEARVFACDFSLCWEIKISLRQDCLKCLLRVCRIKYQVKNIAVFEKAYSVEDT